MLKQLKERLVLHISSFIPVMWNTSKVRTLCTAQFPHLPVLSSFTMYTALQEQDTTKVCTENFLK